MATLAELMRDPIAPARPDPGPSPPCPAGPPAPGPAAGFGSYKSVSTYTSLGAKTLRRLVASGEIRAYRVGRRVVLDLAEVSAWIRRPRRRGASPRPSIVSPPPGPDNQ